MSFVELLRAAMRSPVAVQHEYWVQYDPSKPRLHAFFESPDDGSFYSPHIEALVRGEKRIFPYYCGGKRGVFDAFQKITARHPDVRNTFFFVDKDLDDVLGTGWPTDPRVFTTDVYSIENYLVDAEVLRRFARDAIRFVRIAVDTEIVFARFEREWKRYASLMLSVMAWVVVARRSGDSPVLADADVSMLCEVSNDCAVRAKRGLRISYLDGMPGVTRRSSGRLWRVLRARRELKRLPVKRVVRGKFEMWFFVEYWKRVLDQLQVLAEARGGSLKRRLNLEHSNAVSMLAPYSAAPDALVRFLQAHLRLEERDEGKVRGVGGLLERIARFLSR